MFGEIKTPTLSALAANGVSFTNYHTAASCAPTRAMLLTGVDSHRAGVPNIPEMIPPGQRQARAIELGIVPPDTPMVTMSTTGDWETNKE